MRRLPSTAPWKSDLIDRLVTADMAEIRQLPEIQASDQTISNETPLPLSRTSTPYPHTPSKLTSNLYPHIPFQDLSNLPHNPPPHTTFSGPYTQENLPATPYGKPPGTPQDRAATHKPPTNSRRKTLPPSRSQPTTPLANQPAISRGQPSTSHHSQPATQPATPLANQRANFRGQPSTSRGQPSTSR